jgi:O-antigen/teichoic acid export membrane protein
MTPEVPTTTAVRIFVRAAGTAGLRYASLLVGLVLSAVIARALGPEGRGQYYYPILVALTLQAFLNLGLDPANFFLHSQRRFAFRDLVAQAGTFALLAGGAGILIGLGGWLALRDSLMAGIPLGHFALALVPLPVMLHSLYLTGLLLLQGRTVPIQGIILVASAIQLAAMGGLLLASGGTMAVSSVLAVNSFTLLMAWCLTVRETAMLAPVWPGWRPDVAAAALRFGLRVHGGLILLFVGSRLDAYLVKQLLGLTALGYYSLALAMADLVTVATSALAFAVVPRQAQGTLADAAEVTAKTCRITLALATLLVFGLALVAYPLVTVVYGTVFIPSIVPLLLLLPGVALRSMTTPLGLYLLRTNRPLLQAAIIGLSACVGLGFSFALIPPLGIAGAAIAATLSGALLMAGQLAWFRRHSGLRLGDVVRFRTADLAGLWSARPGGARATPDERSVWPSS